MGIVEDNYKKVVDYFFNKQDAIATLTYARRTLEIIVKAAVRKWDPDANVENRIADLINILKKEKIMPERLIPHARNIQNFGNYGVHDTNSNPDDINITEILPVNASLKALYDWYKKEIEPYVEETVSPMHEVRMNKDKTYSLKPIQ